MNLRCGYTLLDLSALKTTVSDLAQEVDDCFYALSALKGILVAPAGHESVVEFEHMANQIKRTSKEVLFRSDYIR